ncbi:MAG TPA: TRAM domain-containing protein, partial [Gemmataceae bacterium]|nr:TRAM domain-containing protein [Gemmataceae bacterium]
NSYIFKYSPRPGTKGHELYPDDIPEEIKKRRNNDLLAIQNQVSLQDHRRLVGEVVHVLVEGPSKTFLKTQKNNHASCVIPTSSLPQLTGRTPTDHIVVFEGNERLIGQTVQVKIGEATAFTLFGAVVTSETVHCEENGADGGQLSIPTLEANLNPRISLPVIGSTAEVL